MYRVRKNHQTSYYVFHLLSVLLSVLKTSKKEKAKKVFKVILIFLPRIFILIRMENLLLLLNGKFIYLLVFLFVIFVGKKMNNDMELFLPAIDSILCFSDCW